jgi:hypothetical protein
MLNKFFQIFVVIIFLSCLLIKIPTDQVKGQSSTPALNCRFGITSPGDVSKIDLPSLHISALLDWAATKPGSLPAGIDYVHVLRVNDRCSDGSTRAGCKTAYKKTLADIESIVPAHPGEYWEVGNEPDTAYEDQDNLPAETYAARFYNLASRIRVLDPTAKISFGSVVQPTPIRLRYLDKAWNELVKRAGGSVEAASGLIDIWSIHSFIMNEIPGQWGTGVPPGFEQDHADAVHITNFGDTYSISLFSSRVKNFRQWMANKGEENKPLWITEYGSFLPPSDPPGINLVNVSDAATRDFMLKTFDFMLKTMDATGMPDDGYHLVQRWFWYSLNGSRTQFGGTWYDPSKNPPQTTITPVGTGYVNYTPKDNINPEFHFSIDPISDTNEHTKFDFRLINSGTSGQGSARIWAYYDSPDENPVGFMDSPSLSGCGVGGKMDVYYNLPPPPDGVSEVFFRVDTNGDHLPNAGDEIKSININTSSGRSPANGKQFLNNRPTFTWDNIAGASTYNLQVSTTPGFTSTILNVTSSLPYYTMTTDLASNRIMYWRVRAQVGGVNGTWIGPFNFTTANLLGIPKLVSPGNTALITYYRPKLDWNNSSVPTGVLFGYYRIQLTTAADTYFTSPLSDVQVSTGPTASEYTPLSDLASNTGYLWRVRAYNNLKQYSVWSNVFSFRTAILPPVLVSPADGDLTITTRRPVLDWGDVTGASGYAVQISKVANFASTMMTGVPTDSAFTPTSDLPANTLLYWRVQAKGLNGPSLWSSPPRGFRTGNPASIPTLVSPVNNALVTTYHPKLDWANSTLPSSTTFKYYQVELTTATDTTFTSPLVDAQVSTGPIISEYAPSTDYLIPDTTYIWRVRAINTYNSVDQYSAWSNVLSFRTAIISPVLVSPADGDLTITTRRPALDWDDVIGASGYSVQISKYANFASTVMTGAPTTSAYTPTSDLPANTLLYWRVQAKGLNGPGLWSVVRSFKTANPPGIPGLVSPVNKALVTSYHPKLDWSNSTLPAGTVFVYYQIQVATADDPSFTSAVVDQQVAGLTESEYAPLVDYLVPNTIYNWRVRAYNADGQYSAWSSLGSFRSAILPPDLISPPDTDLSVPSRRPLLDWGDVPGANGYNLQISKYSDFRSTVKTAVPTISEYTPTSDLPANTLLYWRVQAKGANGPSLWSLNRSFKIVAPLAPTSLSSEVNPSASKASSSLIWENQTWAPGMDFAYYQVQVATDKTFTNLVADTHQTDQANPRYTLTGGLLTDVEYYWRVRSYDTAGQYSDWSDTGSFHIPIQPPILSNPIDGTDNLTLQPEFSWKQVAGALSYTVVIAPDRDFTILLENGTTKNLVYSPLTVLPAGATLYWWVRAEGNSGSGLWSEIYSFTIPIPLEVLTLETPADNALISDYRPTLTWNPIQLQEGTDFVGYHLQIANENAFANLIVDIQQQDPADSSYTFTQELASDSIYFWRVEVTYLDGQPGGWSVVRSFLTPIQSPIPIFPADSATNVDLLPETSWNAVSGASGYMVEISSDRDFTNLLESGTTQDLVFIPTADLPTSTTLYWRVRAVGNNGPGLWSFTSSFATHDQ